MQRFHLPFGAFLMILVARAAFAAPEPPQTIDLSQAVVIASDESAIVNTAQRMLIEEIAKRTGLALARAVPSPNRTAPAIVLCRIDAVPAALRDLVAGVTVPEKAEGFAIVVDTKGSAPVVLLVGRDERAVLFAAGRLMLATRMGQGLLGLPADYAIATAPRYPIRGHQIGFRNLSHCYDAWTPDIYEQYMRELAVFGANAFETTSFSDPGLYDGPHAKVSRGEMAVEWSRICGEYGYDFWLFTSALGGTGASPEELEKELEERLIPLRTIPHLDHLYLTGGDGGTSHRRPDLMLEWTARCAQEARKLHPGLGIWVSNQGFGPELNNWFFDYLETKQPEWVTGVVYGAWSRILLDEQRARTPKQYPIRRYCDIGHCLQAQYPVAGWDRALARTLGREPFAPRARWHAQIHNLFDQYADGFVTYSDGVGDDINKVVWTALGWDPDRPLDDILLDYARFFFGWHIAEQVRTGLYMLEDNLSSSLAENDGIEKTFALWTALEDQAGPDLLANWRFQECLLRAYFDHYTRLRLLKANAAEERACTVLRTAPDIGVEQAIAQARAILAEPDQDNQTDLLRARIVKLGAELFDSIGAQLDVSNYKARNSERGAVLEFLDTPLNNRLWLNDEFDAILSGRFTATMPEHPAQGDVRLARLDRLVNWEDPGPGGFYDDLGCSFKQPHLVKPHPMWEDPGSIKTPREGHTSDDGRPYRLSWLDLGEALCGTPLVMRYDGLDPEARYRVRVTYLGRYNATIRLIADEQYEVHASYGHTVEGARYAAGYRDNAAAITSEKGAPAPVVTPLEFPIHPAATADGSLELKWERHTGRGIQVAEVWLLKE